MGGIVAYIRNCLADGMDCASALDAAERLERGDLFLSVSAFPEFWALYPNKVGKREAEAAYQRALKRVRHQTIMDGLRRANGRHWSESLGNPPHPSTWLNQDRWADDPIDRSLQATAGMLVAASDEAAVRSLIRRYERDGQGGDPRRDQGARPALPTPANGAGRLL